MKAKLIFSMITGLMLFAFQNCGTEYAAATYKMSENRGNAMDPNKVQVGPSVWPRMDSTIANPVPLTVTQAALPLAIDFGVNPDFREDEALISWGAWLSNWRQLPIEYHQYLGQPRYRYRLDLFKNTVTDLLTDEVVLKLSGKDSAKLLSMMSSSILASASQFNANAGCVASEAKEYATLETDYGLFDLGAGAPCAAVDLFKKKGNGKTVGLDTFLETLEGKLQ